MEREKSKFCPAIWFSGFFGLGAVVHLVRFLLQVPVMIGTFEVPLKLSAVLFLMLAGLSAGLLILGLKRPCGGARSCCP